MGYLISIENMITMTSHERHGVLNRRQLDCLFTHAKNKGTPPLCIIGPLWGEITNDCPMKGQ